MAVGVGEPAAVNGDHHTLRLVVFGDVTIVLVLAVLSYGLVQHFNDTNADLRAVNQRQDRADIRICERGNRLRAVAHQELADLEARARARPPALASGLANAERVIPIVDCQTGAPLPTIAQRRYVARILNTGGTP